MQKDSLFRRGLGLPLRGARALGRRTRQLLPIEQIPLWAAAFLTGAIAVGYSEVFGVAEGWIARLAARHPEQLYVITPLCFLVGWLLVRVLAPEARGSGIPQVIAAIELLSERKSAPFIRKLVGLRTAIVKIASSLVCVLGGGATGREGPTIQIGAGVFSFVARHTGATERTVAHEYWLVTGGAAGIAAAFNTPMGGLVYAVEELAPANFQRYKGALITTVIIAGLAAQWISGPYLYLGFPTLGKVDVKLIPWALLVGATTGIAGASLGRICFHLSFWRRSLRGWWKPALLTVACGLGVAALFHHLHREALGPGREVMLNILFRGEEPPDGRVFAARFFAPILTYLAGCAGGIFAPALAAGAAAGAWLDHLLATDHRNLFAVMGMIGFLTGVTRAPFTAFVLVLEMTDRHSAIFGMMLSALAAQGFSKIIDAQSLYERLKLEFLNAPTERSQPPPGSGRHTGA
ncbi:MAG: chloride channel protein [Bdellovibrionales bacterium]|nr:chloride channel protein [Bdellovibrionales bacterium]